MFFDGPSIFSYGRHFEIARIDAAHDCVLFNTARYSNSTAKHQNYTRGAVSHKDVYYVPSMTDHKANAEHYLKEMELRRAAAVRARSNGEWLKGELNSFIDTAEAYATTYKKEIPRPLCLAIAKWKLQRIDGTLFSAAEIAKIKAATLAARAANAEKTKADAARHALREKNQRDILDAWERGGDTNPTFNEWEFPALGTRLRIKDKRIETSRGAQITLRAAVELWRALTAGDNVAGMALDDNYTVTSWDGAVLIVGCHQIPAGELLKLAAVLKLEGTLTAPRAAGVI